MGNIQDDIKEIKDKLDEQEVKKSKLKIPFFKRVMGGKAKKNYVTVLKINENKTITTEKVQIKDQTILIDKVPRIATSGNILYWGKNPVLIQPSWATVPFSPEQANKDSLTDGSNKIGYELLLSRMETEKFNPTKKMGGMIGWIIGIGLLAIIGYAFIKG